MILSRWREFTPLVGLPCPVRPGGEIHENESKNVMLFVAVIVLLALAVSPAAAESSLSVDVYGLPLVFVQNEGQVGDDVLYHANAPAHGIYFTKDSVVCTMGTKGDSPAAVEITLVGHAPDVVVTGGGKLEGTANFFIGNEPGSWVRRVPTYGSVRYENILPGWISSIPARRGSSSVTSSSRPESILPLSGSGIQARTPLPSIAMETSS